MESINSTPLAEVMLGGVGVPLVEAELFLTSQQSKLALMNFGHDGVFLGAQGTIAFGKFHQISFNLKCYRATMARSLIGFRHFLTTKL